MTREKAIKVLRSLYKVQRLDTLTQEEMTAVAMAIEALKSNAWIPIKTRPMTEEEKNEFVGKTEILDCPLPDDGQEVLVTVYGNTCIDEFCRDSEYGCYFEGYDIKDVKAWRPLPEHYEEEQSENKSR